MNVSQQAGLVDVAPFPVTLHCSGYEGLSTERAVPPQDFLFSWHLSLISVCSEDFRFFLRNLSL